ncbi:MAG: hypothetical protein OEN56_10455 [Gemmatimonadota bacterium]|nr:hypothetical protein [Gemmatimonadota bacterium]
MMRSSLRLLALSGIAGGCGATTSGAAGPCDSFVESLARVPHVSLTTRTGRFESQWDGRSYDGCEVEFETHDSLSAGSIPDLFATPDSELYGEGWRMSDGVGADGAGSGIHGIERGDDVCVIRWEQPAYIDDDGEFVQSDRFRMWIQCWMTSLSP